MSGQLYQLQLGKAAGDVVKIAGPWDTWGRVIKLQPTGFHLIRGLGHSKPLEVPNG